MARYQYQHLQDGRSFRLLSLLPGNDPADPIRCQLQVHSLTEDGQIPQYTALSYVWGDPSLDIHVECNGGILPVNRGCFQALRSLRDSLRDLRQGPAFTPYFWVDAICINQSDKREKSAQVRLMGDIYRFAETVLCFIGDSYSQEDLYVSNHLGSKTGLRRRLLRQDPRASGGWKADRDILGVNNLRESAVRKLFESQYWTRLWTFQEALLSHRKIVFSGTDIIEWESVGILLQQAAVVKREGVNHLLPKAIHFYSLTTTSSMLRLLLDRNSANFTGNINKTYTQSLSLEISRILSFSSELRTSDPRDKIYALTGVMAALEVDLEIDYYRPMALIYKDSIGAFSMKTWSFEKWVIESEDVPFSFLDLKISNTFHQLHSLPVRSKESTFMSHLTKPRPRQVPRYLRCGEGITGAPINEALPNTVQSRVVHSVKEEVSFSENDDEANSTISLSSPELVELSYLSLAHSLARSFSIRKRNWLISRVTIQLRPMLSQCTGDGGNGRCQQVASRSNEHASNQDISLAGLRHKNQRRQRDRDEHSDDEGNQQHPRKKSKGNDLDDIKKLLACPFHQRDPHRISINRSCNGPGWASIARLKEHLYRVHFVHRCRRCKSRFDTAAGLDSHYEDLTPCAVSSAPPDPMEGFNEHQRENLKCRRVQDWKKIYQILFPDDDERSIPSQYYASVVTITDILDQFDRAYQQEVERQLPGRVRSVLEGLSSRPISSIQDEILLMVNDINSTVINSFRQRMVGVMLDNSNPASQEQSEVTTLRVEPSLDNPASFFLEYLNHIDYEYNMPHHLDNEPGFDINSLQNSTSYEYTDEQDYGLNLLQTGDFHGAYDERSNTPTIIQNGDTDNPRGLRRPPNQTGNYDSDSADEWTVVETPPKGSP
ncbi:heterokaryon incompatibility protein-domain-containing protein [Daldinia decipiens]|uniref:heterokaryon incompatibility protein-domain-containing protein n=1 Tax=Daldinia decipiens TaxID=326647 RepID=UPI0020C2A4FE|nr:heterokaryon incompatibility protein-domain-containing protein [Daldinia decipiens]KAI1657766.1 heterokaryon incompatibility protein-domain-containing protein [Daldinia decipiens]